MGCAASLSALAASVILASTGEDRSIVIGTEDSFPPYVIRDEAGGLQGFDVDVMTEVCRRGALTCDWQTASFDELIPSVVSGRFDVVLGGMAITPERRQVVDFSVAYTWGGAMEWFVGPPGAPAPQTARIAVEAGTIHESWLRHEGLQFRSYPSELTALEAVASGQADLALGPFNGRVDLEPAITGRGFAYLYEVEIPDEGTGIAVCKGNAALLAKIDSALLAMQQDGTLEQLDSLWFPN